MSYADRRCFLRSVAAGSLTLLAGVAVPLGSALASSRVVPVSPKQLTRRIARELIDGETLSVTRVWRIRFAAVDQGWIVEGDQLAVDVEAPAGLAAIARIERERPASECFPLELRPDGLIRFDLARASGLDMDEVSRVALETFDRLGGNLVERQEARDFIAQLDGAAQSLITRFPQDLFFPPDEPVVERRSMDLPNGMLGEIEMHYAAISSIDGLLQSSERRVTTSIGGESLRSVERWELA